MATFKVGDKVRVVRSDFARWSYLVGMEGVVVRPGSYWDWIVSIPGAPRLETLSDLGDAFGFYSHELAPLTDPGADAYIERVKSWKPEPVEVAREKFIRRMEEVVGPLAIHARRDSNA